MVYSPAVVLFKGDMGDWKKPVDVDILTSAVVNAGDVRESVRREQEMYSLRVRVREAESRRRADFERMWEEKERKIKEYENRKAVEEERKAVEEERKAAEEGKKAARGEGKKAGRGGKGCRRCKGCRGDTGCSGR
jgi:membrane protein involved in colicin uptake